MIRKNSLFMTGMIAFGAVSFFFINAKDTPLPNTPDEIAKTPLFFNYSYFLKYTGLQNLTTPEAQTQWVDPNGIYSYYRGSVSASRNYNLEEVQLQRAGTDFASLTPTDAITKFYENVGSLGWYGRYVSPSVMTDFSTRIDTQEISRSGIDFKRAVNANFQQPLSMDRQATLQTVTASVLVPAPKQSILAPRQIDSCKDLAAGFGASESGNDTISKVFSLNASSCVFSDESTKPFITIYGAQNLTIDGKGAMITFVKEVAPEKLPKLGEEITDANIIDGRIGIQISASQKIALKNMILRYDVRRIDTHTSVSSVSYGVIGNVQIGDTSRRAIILDETYQNVLPEIKHVIRVEDQPGPDNTKPLLYTNAEGAFFASGENVKYQYLKVGNNLVVLNPDTLSDETKGLMYGLPATGRVKIQHMMGGSKADLFNVTPDGKTIGEDNYSAFPSDISLQNITVTRTVGRLGSFRVLKGFYVDNLIVDDKSLDANQEHSTVSAGLGVSAASDVIIQNSTINHSADDAICVVSGGGKTTPDKLVSENGMITFYNETIPKSSYVLKNEKLCFFGQSYAPLACLKIEGVDRTNLTVTLSGSFPDSLKKFVAFVTPELGMTKRVVVRNNSFFNGGTLRPRGSNVFIGNNTINYSYGKGIVLNNSISDAVVEGQVDSVNSGLMRNIVIAENTLSNLGTITKFGAIGVLTETPEGPLAYSPSIQRVTIRGNKITNVWSPPIFISGTSEVAVFNNVLTIGQKATWAEQLQYFDKSSWSRKAQLAPAAPIMIHNSQNVRVQCVRGAPEYPTSSVAPFALPVCY